jgi:hypothetical protein
MMLTTVVERKHSTFNLPAADSWLRINADCASLKDLPRIHPTTPGLHLHMCGLLHLSVACYHVSVLMKRYMSSTTRRCIESILTSFLLVGLLFSSSVTLGARNLASRMERESGPTSIRPAATLFRNYALTTIPGQRTAGDTSKQNRIKHPVTHGGLAPRESGVPATAVHQLLSTDRSVLYLCFRVSPPGGRAPPASA